MNQSRFHVIVICLVISSLFVSCSINGDEKEITEQNCLDPEATTQTIKDFARAFAEVVLNDDSLSVSIQEEAAKKFDGDTDVLFSTVRNYPVSDGQRSGLSSRGGYTLADAIARKSGSTGSRALTKVDKIDALNIYHYVPDGYLPGQKTSLVAYTDYTVSEEDASVINAFTSNGEAIELDAKNAPDFPVFVIGLNERMDIAQGNSSEADSKAIVGNSQYLQLYQITLKSKMEGWNLGAPEVFFMVNDANSSGTVSNIVTRACPSVDKVNTTYPLGYSLFRYYTSAYDDLVTVWVLEDDSDLLWSATINVNASFNTSIEGDGTISTTGSVGAGAAITYTTPATQAFCGKKFTTEDEVFDCFLVYAADGLGYLYNGGNCSFTFSASN